MADCGGLILIPGSLAALRPYTKPVQTGSLEGSVPIEDAIPGWPGGREL